MILPIGDAPNPQDYTPWVTWLLIAANVLIYLVWTLPMGFTPADPANPAYQAYLEWLTTVVPPQELSVYLGRITEWDVTVFERGYRPSDPEVQDLFSSMFMHAGFAHLAGNMLFLWIYGDNVEHRLGRLPFLLAYLGTGIAATLSFAWLAGASGTPLVGASGAISGVLGLYFVAFPRNLVKLLVGLPPFLLNVILLPAWIVLAAYVVFSNLLPLLSGGPSNVAYGAHLGGFVAGVAVALPLVYAGQWFGARPAEDQAEDVRKRAEALAAQGQPVQALQLLARALGPAQGGEQAEIQLVIGRILAAEGRRTDAFQWLMRALQHPQTAGRARGALADLGLDERVRERFSLQ